MKNRLKLIVIVLLYFCISACTKTDQINDGFLQGIYDISNQSYEARETENTQILDEKPPTYYQYKKEREKILSDSKRSDPQQQ